MIDRFTSGPPPQHLQPGTIPYRVVKWLQAMGDMYPDRWYPTPEVCESLDCDSLGFSAYMKTARIHGLVATQTRPETGKLLWWKIGDGQRVDLHAPRERDEPLNAALTPDLTRMPTSPFPQPRVTRPVRAIEWDGKLLVTGMEIRDGVAIFEPEHIAQLKQHTDWWRAA